MALPAPPTLDATQQSIQDLIEQARSLSMIDPVRARQLAETAIELAQDCPERALEAKIHLASVLLVESRFDDAERLLTSVGAHLNDNRDVLCVKWLRVRSAHQERVGLPNQALALAFEALAVLNSLPDTHPQEAGSLHNRLGLLLLSCGDADGAIEHHMRSYQAIRETGETMPLAAIANNMVMVHRALHDVQSAEECYARAVEHLAELPPSYLGAVVRGNLALVYAENGRPEDALALIDEARTMCETLQVRRGLSTMEHNRGVALLAMHRHEEAVACLTEALELRLELEELFDSHESRVLLADALCRCGKLREAHHQLDLLDQVDTDTPAAAVRKQALRVRYQIYREQQDYPNALYAHEALFEASRQLVEEKDRLHTRALTLRFQTQQLLLERKMLATQAQQLERLSLTDGLTGLPNRRALEVELDSQIRRISTRGGGLSLALMDVDRFKAINDRYTHAVGDKTLRGIAAAVQLGLRRSDRFGRYGGEEFLWILADTPLEAATRAAERMLEAIRTFDWRTVAEGLEVTASFGVAQWAPGESADQLVSRADRALYAAKHSGRNCVRADQDHPG